MNKQNKHLILAKKTVKEALTELSRIKKIKLDYTFDGKLPKEMKSLADQKLEGIILDRLLPTGHSILTEESGFFEGKNGNNLRWVVDPINGTVNFIRGFASCAVSIAMCRGNKPVFGVIGVFPSKKIVWGGLKFGAFLQEKPLKVSKICDKEKKAAAEAMKRRRGGKPDGKGPKGKGKKPAKKK